MAPGMRASTIALTLLLAAPARGRDVSGVSLPETTEVAGRTLHLNGAALRTRFFFRVYVIGLYLEHPAKTADEVLNATGVRLAELHVLRALDGDEVASAIHDGFERNSKDRMPALRERLSAFEKMFPNVKPGDTIAFTFEDGKTIVAAGGVERGTIPGDDFARALLDVWLGPSPVEESVKQGLLGS